MPDYRDEILERLFLRSHSNLKVGGREKSLKQKARRVVSARA